MIPTYNQSMYILDAVKSALAQDYDNKEVIVSDDSTDDLTFLVLKEYIDSRKIIYYKNKKNKGRVQNYRRLLYEYSSGDYVINLDGDDYFIDDSYLLNAAKIIKNNPDIVLVYAKQKALRINETFLENSKYIENFINGNDLFMKVFDENFLIPHLSSIYKRDVAMEIDFYREDISSSDWESIFRLIVENKVCYFDKTVGIWRIHNNNFSGSKDIDVKIKNYVLIENVIKDKKVNDTFSANEIKIWKQNAINHLYHSEIMKLLNRYDYDSAIRLYNFLPKENRKKLVSLNMITSYLFTNIYKIIKKIIRKSDKELIFIFHDSGLTGANIVLLDIITYLSENSDYKINVIYPSLSSEIFNRLKVLKVEIFHLSKISNRFKIFKRLIYYIKYCMLLFTIRPSLVYSNTMFNFSNVYISSLFGFKTLIHLHEGKNILEKYKPKTIFSAQKVKSFITVSNYSKRTFAPYFKKSEFTTIYNGIKLLEKELKYIKEIKSISVIGSIDRNKNQLLAIKAIEEINKNFRNITLNIIGKDVDDTYYDEILEYISNKNIKFVNFLGQLTSQDEIYKSDITLMTSKDEAFPKTILESFLYKKLIIAPRIGGIPESIIHMENGLLYNANDIESLTESIRYAIENIEEVNKMVDKASMRLINKFDIDITHSKIKNFIDKVIEKRH
jgi:glycosyltransferase involved in cell wall biosynthesis